MQHCLIRKLTQIWSKIYKHEINFIEKVTDLKKNTIILCLPSINVAQIDMVNYDILHINRKQSGIFKYDNNTISVEQNIANTTKHLSATYKINQT